MTVVSDRWSHLAVGARVFIRSLSIVGVAETGVPGIEAGDLVTDETGVVPAGSPVNGLANSGRHDDAAVVGHIGAAPFCGAGKGIEATCPMYSEHGSLALCVEG